MANDPACPVRYRMSRGWRRLFVLGGLPFLAGGLAGAVYFGLGHEVTSPGQQAGLIAMCAAFVVFGAWCLHLGTTSRPQLVLHADALELAGVFRMTRIRRADLLGYRRFAHNGMQGLLLQVRTPDGGTKSVNASLPIERDAAFTAWFDGIPDLDARELDESATEVARDPRLGGSPDERLRRVARASRTGRWLLLGVTGLAAWMLFRPEPYVPLFVAMAGVPWLVLALCRLRPAQFSIADTTRRSLRADLTYVLILPGMILLLRALKDVAFVDVTEILLPSLAVLLPLLAAVAAVEPAYRRPGKLGLMAVMLVAYAGSVAAIADVVFDDSAPAWHRVAVHGKRATTGKGAKNLLQIEPWPGADIGEVDVSRAQFAAAAPGDTVCIAVFDGALGADWYAVLDPDRCDER